jgi:uncharacterized protein (TIRG00374 family)
LDTRKLQNSTSVGGTLAVSGTAVKYRKAAQWALAVCCIVWVGWYFYHNRQDLRLFLSLRPLTILILLVLFTVHLWLYSLQFYFVLCQCAGKQLPFVDFFKTIILGRFLSNIAPQSGAVYRAVYLKHKFGISYTRYLSGFFCFLWIDAAMNILLSAAIFGIFEPTFHIRHISIWWVILGLAVLWFLPIVFESLFGRISFQVHWLARLHERFREILQAAVGSLSDHKMLIRVTCANSLNFVNNILIFYLFLSDFKGTITLPILAVFYILLKVSSYLILTPGNLGIREVAYAFLAQQMGLKAGEGMALSIFYQLFGMTTVSLFGIYFGGLKLLDRQEEIDDSNGRHPPEASDAYKPNFKSMSESQ